MILKSSWCWIGAEMRCFYDLVGTIAENEKIKTSICNIENIVIKGIKYELKS